MTWLRFDRRATEQLTDGTICHNPIARATDWQSWFWNHAIGLLKWKCIECKCRRHSSSLTSHALVMLFLSYCHLHCSGVCCGMAVWGEHISKSCPIITKQIVPIVDLMHYQSCCIPSSSTRPARRYSFPRSCNRYRFEANAECIAQRRLSSDLSQLFFASTDDKKHALVFVSSLNHDIHVFSCVLFVRSFVPIDGRNYRMSYGFGFQISFSCTSPSRSCVKVAWVRKKNRSLYKEQSRAEQSRAEQSNATQSRATQRNATQCNATQSKAKQSKAKQSNPNKAQTRLCL